MHGATLTGLFDYGALPALGRGLIGVGKGAWGRFSPASVMVWMRTLIAAGAADQCPHAGHMNARISDHQSLDIVFRPPFVAVFKSTAIGADFHRELVHATWEFGVAAAQAAIPVGLARGHRDWQKRREQRQSAD
jgi:hypothetical protein